MRRLDARKVFGIGIASWIGGIMTEKYAQSMDESSKFWKMNELLKNCMTVKASKAFSSPDVKSGGGVVPIKSNDDTPDSKWFWSQHPYEQRINQIMRFGFPTFENVRSFKDFVLSYDKRNRVPNWVFEHLTKNNCSYNTEVDRSRCEFFEDSSLHPFFRSSNLDYKGSGYDRGHLAAAGNHKSSQDLCEETFVLSNIAPQVGKGFNRDAWNSLEKYARRKTKEYENVYICSGPLYLPRREANGRNYVHYEVIGSNHVAVPTHFFKVIVGETDKGQLDMESFVMPNVQIDDKLPIKSFQVPIETIERAAGFLLFDKVQKNFFRQINGHLPRG